MRAESLGSPHFKYRYGVKYAYAAGAMYRGIASSTMVIAMARARILSFLGTGGMKLAEIEDNVLRLRSTLVSKEPFGVNLLSNPENSQKERHTVEIFLRNGVMAVEAAAYIQITPSIVRYRLSGIKRSEDGTISVPNRILAKVSRPSIAAMFMTPPPEPIIRQLVQEGLLTADEAGLGEYIPLADDICVESDSGGHTDRGVAHVLFPAILAIRDQVVKARAYDRRVCVGAAGGIGTPVAAAAAFFMGADFILTGSINQCTVEAGTSNAVKDLLQEMETEDTTYAPAGDMFEIGAQVQVLKRGLFFPSRANRLYELYSTHGSIDEVEPKIRHQLEQKYFCKSFDEIWEDTRRYLAEHNSAKLAEIERSPKKKMATIFKWYFRHSSQLALRGISEKQVDYQIHCGPALGAFNRWVKDTEMASWQNRHVTDVSETMMKATALFMSEKLIEFVDKKSASSSTITPAPWFAP